MLCSHNIDKKLILFYKALLETIIMTVQELRQEENVIFLRRNAPKHVAFAIMILLLLKSQLKIRQYHFQKTLNVSV